jgi:predicted transcriptional regulator YdeE
MWTDDFDKIMSTMQDRTSEDKEALLRMIGLQKRLQNTCKQNLSKIKQLHDYLDELDRRRGTDWRSLFPYLIV